MSREINIGYRYSDGGSETDIKVRTPYFLLGTQSTSMRFWSLPRLREIGISQLTELGVADPIYFIGWDMLANLHREIALLQEYLGDIEFDADIKASWLSHLWYCYYLLVLTAPKESTPIFTIG